MLMLIQKLKPKSPVEKQKRSLAAEFYANCFKTPKMQTFWIFTGNWVIVCVLQRRETQVGTKLQRQTDG